VTQILWIWSSSKHRWTDGHYTITQEVIERYPWSKIVEIFSGATGRQLPCEKFEVPSHRKLKDILMPDYNRFTPEEIRRILDGDK
jgi:hypothetical protein